MKPWLPLLLLALLLPRWVWAAEPLREGRRTAYLRGLGFERQGAYDSAKNEYRRLPLDSQKRQERLFLLQLEHRPTAHAPGPQALAQQVRYLIFQGYFGEAYALLSDQPGRGYRNAELDQQRAQLALWFGDLAGARRYLDRSKPDTEALSLEHRVLEFWLHFLAREDPKALATARKMAEELLYLPRQALPLSDESIERWVLLYPDSSALLDQWVALLVESGRWAELDRLCQQQQGHGLPSPKAGYCQLGQKLGRAQGYGELSAWVLARRPRPEVMDRLARWALEREDWNGLARLGRDFSRLYPELEDGRLYRQMALSKSSEGSGGSL